MNVHVQSDHPLYNKFRDVIEAYHGDTPYVSFKPLVDGLISSLIAASSLLELAAGFHYYLDIDEYRSPDNGNSYHGFYIYIADEVKGKGEFTALFYME